MFVDNGTRASPDNQGPDNQGPDNQGPDNWGPDNWGPDNQGLTVNGGISSQESKLKDFYNDCVSFPG